tara:strand:+ start:194 stop:838 length:645 start_codon:yes stop_codon:yes gene_type:complete
MSTTSEAGAGTNGAWEDSVQLMLERWASGCKTRTEQHERMARWADRLTGITAPLVLVPLVLAPLAGPWSPNELSPATKSLAFALLAIAMGAYHYMDPSGWKERHVGFAERYFELEQAIAEAMDAPEKERRSTSVWQRPVCNLLLRKSFLRQGLAGRPAESFDPPEPGVFTKQGSQQSQLLLIIAARLMKLEGSRPRDVVLDELYTPLSKFADTF